jgi:hypothetical protein
MSTTNVEGRRYVALRIHRRWSDMTNVEKVSGEIHQLLSPADSTDTDCTSVERRIAALVGVAPPLSDDQRGKLRALLNG